MSQSVDKKTFLLLWNWEANWAGLFVSINTVPDQWHDHNAEESHTFTHPVVPPGQYHTQPVS